MREPEGIATPLPGTSSEGPWSRLHEPHFRNVEAEGSSPFTSTKRPGQRGQGGIPQKIRLFDVSLRVFIERVWSPGTDEIGMGRGRARDYPAVRGVSIDATFVGSKSSFFLWLVHDYSWPRSPMVG